MIGFIKDYDVQWIMSINFLVFFWTRGKFAKPYVNSTLRCYQNAILQFIIFKFFLNMK